MRPIPAVLAVVIRDGRVLLARRANPPDAGLWGFPGGKVEWGEPLGLAAERELAEETGITATAQEVITALDAFDPGPGGPVHHFILIAVRCLWQQGDPSAADDALDARWFPLDDLGALPLSAGVADLAQLAARPSQAYIP